MILMVDLLPDEVGIKSEQATVHSAPFPWPFLFEVNKTFSLPVVDLKLFGPFFWQNLGNT